MINSDDKADINRAIALAIAELIRHGGSVRDVETLVEQFKALAEEKESVTDARKNS